MDRVDNKKCILTHLRSLVKHSAVSLSGAPLSCIPNDSLRQCCSAWASGPAKGFWMTLIGTRCVKNSSQQLGHMKKNMKEHEKTVSICVNVLEEGRPVVLVDTLWGWIYNIQYTVYVLEWKGGNQYGQYGMVRYGQHVSIGFYWYVCLLWLRIDCMQVQTRKRYWQAMVFSTCLLYPCCIVWLFVLVLLLLFPAHAIYAPVMVVHYSWPCSSCKSSVVFATIVCGGMCYRKYNYLYVGQFILTTVFLSLVLQVERENTRSKPIKDLITSQLIWDYCSKMR